jgi:hypothetical protein
LELVACAIECDEVRDSRGNFGAAVPRERKCLNWHLLASVLRGHIETIWCGHNIRHIPGADSIAFADPGDLPVNINLDCTADNADVD